MSRIYSQLARDGSNPGREPASQMELQLPGLPPGQAPAGRALRTKSAAKPSLPLAPPLPTPPPSGPQAAAPSSAPADSRPQSAAPEEALSDLRRELAKEKALRQSAQTALSALQKEIEELRDRHAVLTAERDRLAQLGAEQAPAAIPAPEAREIIEKLERQKRETEDRLRLAEASAAQSCQALAAEKLARSEERLRANARERDLAAQLLSAEKAARNRPGFLYAGPVRKRIGAYAVAVLLVAVIAAILLVARRSSDTPEQAAAIRPVPEASFKPREQAAAAQEASLPDVAMAGIKARQDGQRIEIVFDKGVFSRRAAMTGEAGIILKELAARLHPVMYAYRLQITGHTDPDPVGAGDCQDNTALGLQRAQTVATYLASECSIPAGAISIASAGDANAPYPNTTPELRRKNRTVTIIVSPR